MVPVVFIVGSGYSGSTLLDLLLGAHPAMVGLGELDHFDAFVCNDRLCTCRRSAHDCPFWAEVLERLQPQPFVLRPPGSSADEVIDRTVSLYRAIQGVSGGTILVDSSKRPRRARLLWETGQLRSWAVHLLRDGRGVAWSHARRGDSFLDALEYWNERNAQVRDWLDLPCAPPQTTLWYEDLATDPERVLRQVCALVGVDFCPQMLQFRGTDHHQVSGNLMRFAQSDQITLDDGWKQELGQAGLVGADRVLGSPDVVLRPAWMTGPTA